MRFRVCTAWIGSISKANTQSGSVTCAGLTVTSPMIKARWPPDTMASPAAPTPAPESGRTPEVEEINPLLVGARESLEKGEYLVALADVDRILSGNAQNPDAVELKKAVLYGLGKSQLGQNKLKTGIVVD